MLARYMLSSCVRLSVRPSVQAGIVLYPRLRFGSPADHASVINDFTVSYCIETTVRIELVFGMDSFSTYTTLRYKEMWVSPKITVAHLSLGLCPKLRTLKISSRQVDRVVDKDRRRVVDGRVC